MTLCTHRRRPRDANRDRRPRVVISLADDAPAANTLNSNKQKSIQTKHVHAKILGSGGIQKAAKMPRPRRRRRQLRHCTCADVMPCRVHSANGEHSRDDDDDDFFLPQLRQDTETARAQEYSIYCVDSAQTHMMRGMRV